MRTTSASEPPTSLQLVIVPFASPAICSNVKSSTGRNLSIMGIDRSTNAPYYSRINRSQEQNKEQEQAKAQEQTAERQQAVFEEKTRSQGMSV